MIPGKSADVTPLTAAHILGSFVCGQRIKLAIGLIRRLADSFVHAYPDEEQ
jgi:hypothetical protein